MNPSRHMSSSKRISGRKVNSGGDNLTENNKAVADHSIAGNFKARNRYGLLCYGNRNQLVQQLSELAL
ncbi:hypothetical protein T4D_11377 [Trichinella pseudospiralis]|uniref:Uncharacterized protein n=1 Tax=Trichinella pseudospiralis TaxID=6337 RepID=A0A0V1FKT7_TRIPS|nr:hypothetical protein T4D_11377 [Trichinella pseudospiralis]